MPKGMPWGKQYGAGSLKRGNAQVDMLRGSQGGQGEGAKGRNVKGDFPGGPKGVMAKENDKGDTKWEGQRVRWGHTKRGNAEGSQGGHRGVLSVKLNPFNGLHLSSRKIKMESFCMVVAFGADSHQTAEPNFPRQLSSFL